MFGARWGAACGLPLFLNLLSPATLQAHDAITTKLTWTAEISRIFAKRCIACHHDGGSAPMALTTYAGTRPWAVAIREEVLERRMPPWNAVKGFGEFAEDGALSQEEIQRIAEWVTGGAPEGEPQYLAPMRPQVPNSDPRAARGFLARNGSVLEAPLNLHAIQPASIPSGASLKVTAQLPDGSVQPLLWILGYRREWNRQYAYREPVPLPKGTRIEVHPPQNATFRLLGADARRLK